MNQRNDGLVIRPVLLSVPRCTFIITILSLYLLILPSFLRPFFFFLFADTLFNDNLFGQCRNGTREMLDQGWPLFFKGMKTRITASCRATRVHLIYLRAGLNDGISLGYIQIMS
ncbi:hypothetical protein ABW19_dt0202127 [Dactylella cylindrospora]|nr:hypothetical protein ABW19_dt0202127 [Dactylella cylindrospora]